MSVATPASLDLHRYQRRDGRKLIESLSDLFTVFLDADDNIKLGDFGLSKNLVAGAFTQTYVGVSPLSFS